MKEEKNSPGVFAPGLFFFLDVLSPGTAPVFCGELPHFFIGKI